MNRRLLLALLACVAATAAHAALGETLAQLTQRVGSKPEPQPRKDAAVWFFEVQDGRLVYNVTFDAKGLSIAEGLKPLRSALFAHEAAEDFISAQIARIKDSKTLRMLKPGDKYAFGGKPFICGEQEYVTLDEANDVLIVWNRSRDPSIIAVRRAMLK